VAKLAANNRAQAIRGVIKVLKAFFMLVPVDCRVS